MIITDVCELVGKTIKKAEWIDCGDRLGLVFTDGDYAAICGEDECDGVEANMCEEIGDYELVQLGIISEKERVVVRDKKAAELQNKRKLDELAELKRLKEKYGEEG